MTFVINYLMGFWKNVDSELFYLGKTRKELAQAVGFDVTCISSGIRRDNIPAADTALKIAQFLNVPLDQLIYDKTLTVSSPPDEFALSYSSNGPKRERKIQNIDNLLNREDKSVHEQLGLYRKYEDIIDKLEKLDSKTVNAIKEIILRLESK